MTSSRRMPKSGLFAPSPVAPGSGSSQIIALAASFQRDRGTAAKLPPSKYWEPPGLAGLALCACLGGQQRQAGDISGYLVNIGRRQGPPGEGTGGDGEPLLSAPAFGNLPVAPGTPSMRSRQERSRSFRRATGRRRLSCPALTAPPTPTATRPAERTASPKRCPPRRWHQPDRTGQLTLTRRSSGASTTSAPRTAPPGLRGPTNWRTAGTDGAYPGRPGRRAGTAASGPSRPEEAWPGVSHACSNIQVDVQRPGWWTYPESCRAGHPWGPGTVTAAWQDCTCDNAQAVEGLGHLVLRCGTPGCTETWRHPPHRRITLPRVLGHHRPGLR